MRAGWISLLVAVPLWGCSPSSDSEPLGTSQVALQRVSNAELADAVRQLAASRGVTEMPAPPVLPLDLVELGRMLVFDKELSGNRDIACMTCHLPSAGTADARALPIGTGGEGLGRERTLDGDLRVQRNAPPMFNLHVMNPMMWDGRFAFDPVSATFLTDAGPQIDGAMASALTLGAASAQALFPVTSRDEMRGFDDENELAEVDDDDFTGIWAAVMDRLEAIPEYQDRFEDAYPGTAFADMSFAHAANAIAAFEINDFHSDDAPWDRFLAGDDSALNRPALEGALLFFSPDRANCVACHTGPSFTDQSFHNTAQPQLGPGKGDGDDGADDFGRERVTGDPADRYRFRTPTLRNVALTDPYGHVGQFKFLETHILHYADPAESLATYNPQQLRDPLLRDLVRDNAADVLPGLDPLVSTVTLDGPEDVRLLVAFLRRLTGDGAKDLCHIVPATVPSGLPVDGCPDQDFL